MDEKEALITQIHAAFANTIYPGDDNLINANHCQECADIYEAFRGKQWESLTDVRFLRRYEAALSLLYPEAFRYYLPAFMRAALVDHETADVILDGLEFHLSPPEKDGFLDQESLQKYGYTHTDSWLRRVSSFTTEQKSAIRAYLEFETYPRRWTIKERQEQQHTLDFWDTFAD
jgi:hypothetical protein